MSLKLIAGSSGSGKSYTLYKNIIEESQKNPETNYIVVVPEQFTMSTQKELVRLHPAHAISNIDVVSFARLAYRIMEETGESGREVLDEIGRSLILRKVAGEKEKDLTILAGNIKKVGYISEMKSAISEFTQYGVGTEDLEELLANGGVTGALERKLKDILIIYKAFREDIAERYIIAEEVLDCLSALAAKSQILKGSIIAFDGFTGFTPIQYKVLGQLLKCASEVQVTVTLHGRYSAGDEPAENDLFRLSKTTINKLWALADSVGCKVEDILYIEDNYRLSQNSELLFLEENIFREGIARFEGECRNISIQSCPDPVRELEAVAGEISRIVREEGYRYRDISIVTGDVATYSRLAGPVMRRFGIPCFMDYKRDVMGNPFIECILSALAAICDNFSYDSMFRYLKSGILMVPEEDLFLLENLCIARGIRGSRWTQKWRMRKKDSFTKEEMERINVLREKTIGPLSTLKSGFGKKSTGLEKTRALYDFLVEIGAQQILKDKEQQFAEAGDTALEKEYSQIYKYVIDLLDEYAALLGNEELTKEEYVQILEAGFAEARIGIIPPGMDRVTLGDITRTRLGDIKVLFFVGVNDGTIPAGDNGGGIISQTERAILSEKISMAPTVREKTFIERFYLYLNLTKPSRKLYVSYSNIDSGGKAVLPSYLILVLTGMFGKSILHYDLDHSGLERIVTPESALSYLTEHFIDAKEGREDELWRDLYRWYANNEEYKHRLEGFKEAAASVYDPGDDNLGKDLASKLYGEVLYNSVSRIEDFTKCAFAHFLKRGLELSEREEFGMDFMSYGNIVHGVLERVANDFIKGEYSWQTVPEEVLDSLVEESVASVAEDMFSDYFADNPRNKYEYKRINNMVKNTARAIQHQMKAGLFSQVCAERQFEYKLKTDDGENEVSFSGKIDRMDVYEEKDSGKVYLKIIDYKTGPKDFEVTELVEGLSIQLAVYLEAATRVASEAYPGKETVPAAVLYLQPINPIAEGDLHITQDKLDDALFNSFRTKGLCNGDPGIARLMDRECRAGGASRILPVKIDGSGAGVSKSNVVSSQTFSNMREFVNKKIRELSGRIISGEAQINPFVEGEDSCKYCRFRPVCRIDGRIPGYPVRSLDTDKEAAWKKINGEGDNNA